MKQEASHQPRYMGQKNGSLPNMAKTGSDTISIGVLSVAGGY